MATNVADLVAEAPATPPSLEAFVAEHYRRLVRLAALISRSAPDAEDAVQMALERAVRSFGTLGDPERLRPWLDRIVVRETLRLVSRRARVTELHVVSDASRPGPMPEEVAVRVALQQLSPQQRAVVALHLYAGHTVPATARILGIPEETVRSRLRIAREHLRRLLGEEDL